MHSLLVKAGSGAAALTAGAGLLLATASSAVADTPQVSISVQGPATLIAHGAAINVPVIADCSVIGGIASVNVSASQAVGKRTAFGVGSTQIGCTGLPQTMLVQIGSNGVPFSKGGNVLVTASIFICGDTACGQAVDQAIIKIK